LTFPIFVFAGKRKAVLALSVTEDMEEEGGLLENGFESADDYSKMNDNQVLLL
jgi:hypothetical protein